MIHLARRRLLQLGVALALARPVFARADDAASIQAPIAALDNGLLAIMKAGVATPFPQRFQMLAPQVDGAIDTSEILQRSVGPGWSSVAPEQQTALQSVFRIFTIASYVANFASFHGEMIQMLPELRTIGDDRIVQTSLVPLSGSPTPIDYVMQNGASGWRAVDVLLNGSISRVAVQRSDFRSLIRTGDASRLLQSLQRKVADLSAGTIT